MTDDRLEEIADTASGQQRLTSKASAQLREIAHELRNPLNALTAITEILKNEHFGPLGDPRYREYATLAHDAAGKMMKLCDRLVIESADAPLAPEVSVARLLTDIAAMYRPMAEARGLVLDVDIQDELPELAVNAELLGTVLDNLVTNAIKFTPRGGRVTLLARREPLENVAVFVVSDSGIGLDAEKLAMQMGRTTAPEGHGGSIGPHGDTGAGIGLAIARKSLARLGGSLELRSREGAGTCAIVRLPIGPVTAVA